MPSDMSKPIMTELEHMVRSVKGWDDDPPHLFALYNNSGRVKHGIDLVPSSVWTLDRPPQILEVIAQDAAKDPGIAGLLSESRPGNWIGLVFMHEAWVMKMDPAKQSQAEIDAINEDSRNHVIYKRPDKTECRIAYAQTTFGPFFAILERDGPFDVSKQENPEEVDRGTVPEALLTLFRVFTKDEGHPAHP